MSSSFVRKTRKLFRNPHGFFYDSKNFKFLMKRFGFLKVEKKIENNVKPVNNAKEKNGIQVNFYDAFNLNEFHKSLLRGEIKKSQKKATELWSKYPWSLKGIKAHVFIYDYLENYYELINFMRLSLEKLPSSDELKLLYVKYLRKSGVYSPNIVQILEAIINNNSNNIPARFFLCEYLWESSGISKKLLLHIDFLKKNSDKLNDNQKNFISACLCEAGKYTECIDYFDEVKEKVSRKYFSVEMIYNYKRHNDRTKVEEFNRIMAFQSAFENLIRTSEKIAIVGNAPTEIGKNNGRQIDESDLVIRFNNFSVSSEFIEDYGQKTHIWVKSGFYQDIERRDISELLGIIQSGINPLYRNSSFNDFYLDAMLSNINFTFIPPKIYYELITKLNSSPSAGLCILYWIFKIIGPISRDMVYGFSFGEQSQNKAEHYFKNSKSSGYYPHDWEKEGTILNEIVV